MRYLLPFTKIDKEDVAIVGGKGANLGEMTRAGFPVPPGYVVTGEAYFHFIDQTGLRQKIHQLLSKLDVEDSKALDEASSLIHRAFTRTAMPADIEKEIITAYRDMSKGKKLYVAIRSSSTGEDLEDATAAGQQSTFLNVIGDDQVVHFVREAWASLFTARAIFYRHQKKISHFKTALAVPIQAMVNSEVSGIAFSIDPFEVKIGSLD